MGEKNPDELIQYYVVNGELGMSAGKIAAQVAHAAIDAALHEAFAPGNSGRFSAWYHGERKKIILRGRQTDLEKLAAAGFHAVRDLGYTEVAPDSLTCVVLPVMTRREAKKYIGRLRLL